MIILSQKGKILNFDNIIEISTKDLTIYDEGCYVIVAETVNNKEKELGVYNTEERAKEVLQEIIKCYGSYLQLDGGPAIIQGQVDIQPNIFNIPKVYKMPGK